MSDPRKDEIYKEHYKQGRNGGVLDDISHNIGKGFSISEEGELKDTAYQQGMEDRANYGRLDD